MKKFAFWLLFTFSLNFSTIVIGGDSVAGAKKYNAKCKQCHGPAGKGIASYPRIYGKEISYIKSRLETYRSGKEIGANSALMIMMAKPLTDDEIENLAAYLKDARPE